MQITPLVAFFATLIFIGILGMVTGYFLYYVRAARKQRRTIDLINDREEESRTEAFEIVKQAQDSANTIRTSLEKEKQTLLAREALLIDQGKEIEQEYSTVQELKRSLKDQLANIAGISEKEALDRLIRSIEEDERDILSRKLQALKESNKEQLDKKAQEILVSSIQRFGSAIENDVMSTVVKLGADDAKGKIIGKDGKNIKSFERETGVQVIIDETPGVVTISSFDPLRRVIAKKALEELLSDGRVQPARIETVVRDVKEKIDEIIREKGREAAVDAKVQGLTDDLLYKLGSLYYRYSYGQNVLQHSVEMAHIAGMLADQVGADAQVARAGALLHDIGKAQDHTVEGSHVEIGRTILRREGIDEAVIKAMQSHHEEYPYETVESILVQVADSISGGRPGARSDVADMYVKKLDGIEKIASEIPGVEDAYAISAGREVRIFVNPESVDDHGARKIARQVAEQIEKDLKYPGEIKVHVIRESKIVDYAR